MIHIVDSGRRSVPLEIPSCPLQNPEFPHKPLITRIDFSGKISRPT
jgi:hypothetical protein